MLMKNKLKISQLKYFLICLFLTLRYVKLPVLLFTFLAFKESISEQELQKKVFNEEALKM